VIEVVAGTELHVGLFYCAEKRKVVSERERECLREDGPDGQGQKQCCFVHSIFVSQGHHIMDERYMWAQFDASLEELESTSIFGEAMTSKL
jgi:hypothetical protein